MMGKNSRQLKMLFIDIDDLVPENHLLKQIDKLVDFEFIYELAAPYYSTKGRKSIDPVTLIKMLLIGYLYGIKSERRLVEEVQVNIAYRWFCGLDLSDNVPEHSLFSHYLAQMTVDTLEHIKRIKMDTGLTIESLALDAGYDVGAVHRGLEVLGITGYVSRREFHNAAMRKGFAYLPENDCFTCMKGHHLNFEALVYKKTSQGYYRVYSRLRSKCKGCEYLQHCAMDRGRIRINASPFYPAFYANMHRCETMVYKAMKRLRAIWSEGTFAALKREHNLKRARKRGLNRMSEECLLSALALNLKRIVKALGQPPYLFGLTIISQWRLCSKCFSQIIILILSTGPKDCVNLQTGI